MKKQKVRRKLSKIVGMHYVKLIFRSLLFITATIVYIYNRLHETGYLFSGFENNDFLLGTIWVFFAAGMVLRFFPARLESMGCQKQFKKNYKEIPNRNKDEKVKVQSGWLTFWVAVAWFTLNGIIGVLYFTGIIDAGILLLISLAYSICDIICILFFCPFQIWFMKNKCCTTCRIYNWDYAMMFTPLVFIPNLYAWSLLGLALLLLLQWEVKLHMHPEWFSDKCNGSLSCANCQEKLCQHKTQLQGFWRKVSGTK